MSGNTILNKLANASISISESHAFLCQVVSTIGRIDKATQGRLMHFFLVNKSRLKHWNHDLHRVNRGIQDIKESFFILLHIFIVGK